MKKGKLIVFEGVSGTGKETQARLLQKFLASKKITSSIIFHPSPELKIILSSWRKARGITSLTETFLLLADRSSRVNQTILPALAKGEWVISLRNYVSALAYQGKTSRERLWIRSMFAHFEPKADTLFYFDITPKAAMGRIRMRHRKTGEPLGHFETPKLLEEKRKNYRVVMKTIPHVTLDASRSIDEIAFDIQHAVRTLI